MMYSMRLVAHVLNYIMWTSLALGHLTSTTCYHRYMDSSMAMTHSTPVYSMRLVAIMLHSTRLVDS